MSAKVADKINILEDMKARQAKIEALLKEQQAIIEANKDEVEKARAEHKAAEEQLTTLKKEQLAAIEEAVNKVKEKFAPKIIAAEARLAMYQGIAVVAGRAGKAPRATGGERAPRSMWRTRLLSTGDVRLTRDDAMVYEGKDVTACRKALQSISELSQSTVSQKVKMFSEALESK